LALVVVTKRDCEVWFDLIKQQIRAGHTTSAASIAATAEALLREEREKRDQAAQ
jgi:hypothetical protein